MSRGKSNIGSADEHLSENSDVAVEASPQAPMVVEVRGLSRRFGSVEALRGTDLRVTGGEVFGLVGQNGAGKTTLIQHLIGGLRAQSGTVRVFGLDPVASGTTVLADVGYMTEEDSLPHWLTLGQLMRFGRDVYPTWDQDYAMHLSDRFAVPIDRTIGQMSKGVRARAALLYAIAHHPRLLILDEPSSGLDPIGRRELLEMVIRNLGDSGGSVLFSSHLLDEVARVCDRVSIMIDGRADPPIALDGLSESFEEWIVRDMPEGVQHHACVVAADAHDDEWSVIVRTPKQTGPPEEVELFNELKVNIIERRPVALDRYFAARVAEYRSAEKRSPKQESTDQESTDQGSTDQGSTDHGASDRGSPVRRMFDHRPAELEDERHQSGEQNSRDHETSRQADKSPNGSAR